MWGKLALGAGFSLSLAMAAAFAQTAGTLIPNAQQQFTDASGVPLVGGKLYTYVPATTTPKITWADPGLVQANTNPIILDAAGRATIWGRGEYREVLQDSAGNVIWDQVTVAPEPPQIPPTPPPAPTFFGKAMTVDLLSDIPAPGTGAVITFNNFEFDNLGGYSTLSGTFVAPFKGVYLISTSLSFQGSTTIAGNCFAAIWRNGLASRLAQTMTIVAGLPLGTPFGSVPVTGLFQLNGQGDNIQIKGSCNATGSIIVQGGTAESYFSAIWLGNY